MNKKKDDNLLKPRNIYIFFNGYDAYKIGHTEDLKQRKKDLQTANSKPIELIYKAEFEATRNQIEDYEADIHQRFLHLQTSSGNEWFYLKEDDIAQIKILLSKPEQIKFSLEETFDLIFDKLASRPNVHFATPELEKIYLQKPVRDRCAKTFGEEFLLDSYKKSIHLDLKISELPQAPTKLGGKIIGKTNHWTSDFGFPQKVAKNLAWKHYMLRYSWKSIDDRSNELISIIPKEMTLRAWLEKNIK